MKETLNSVSPEQIPPFIVRNALIAHAIAFGAHRILDDGLTSDGRDLLYKLVLRACRGEEVSISRELPLAYQGAKLKIEVDGQNNIPSSGSTIFIGNHTRGGPLLSNGQFIEEAKQGYDARIDVQDKGIREPFVIMQEGLGGWFGKRYATGIFYKIAANALNCEIVSIAKFDKSKINKDGTEIMNRQGLSPTAIQRIVNGGALLWLPQGRHRPPNDFNFPEIKANGFLSNVHDRDCRVQLVPVRSIPDSHGNIKIVFGPAVGISHVVAKGIDHFAHEHIEPLK